MALIHCPECSHQVSDSAVSCPSCGHPITKIKPVTQTVVVAKPSRTRGLYIILGILLGMLGIHNFYAGFYGRGAVQLIITMTLGWVVVGFIINGIWIIGELISQELDADGALMA